MGEELKTLLIICFVLGLTPFTEAAPLDPRSTAVIYNMAQALSKYKLPDVAPVIEYVNLEKLSDLICHKVCPQIYGAQVRERVYLLESLDMDDPFNRAIMFHEFIHFLQWANKGEAKDCWEYLEREQEAYGLQNYILEKIGLHLRMPTLPLCS